MNVDSVCKVETIQITNGDHTRIIWQPQPQTQRFMCGTKYIDVLLTLCLKANKLMTIAQGDSKLALETERM